LRLPRLIWALTLCCLLPGGCADTAGENPEVYVVQPQDSLYSIAWRFNLDYHDLAHWNNIGPDFRIAVGQALALSAASAPPARQAPQERQAPPASHSSSAANSPSAANAPSQHAGNLAGPAPKWVWPTEHLGAPLPVPGGGILLAGHVGQDIRAACAGRVVYSGSGLRSYGNLIIIKHSENLLSAYAHNRDSLVRDGEEVAAGQLIAHMGEGAPQKPVLYFEIRRSGKPIDPTTIFSKIR
jgi:lipoprotein NlpD